MQEEEHLSRAASAFLEGDMPGAEALCQAVFQIAPNHPGAARQLGMIRLVQGDAESALPLLQTALAGLPPDSDLELAIAEARWATGAVTEAIAPLRRSLDLNPDRPLVRARLGLALLTDQQPDAARRELEQVIAARAENAAAHTHLGMALIALGEHEEAVPKLQRAMLLDPADPAPAFHLGRAMRATGQIDPAIEAFAKAVARDANQAHLRVGYGDALLARGDHEQALAQLRQATALDPDSALAWTKLGEAEQIAGDPAAAVECLQRAVALDPGNTDLRAIFGNALFVGGDRIGANVELARSMAGASWALPEAPATDRLRVGVIAAPGIANTPTDYILDRRRHLVEPIYMLNGYDYPAERIADVYDVVFNAVTDPDAAPDSLAIAAALAQRLNVPVINPPAAIPATMRHLMAERLAGIPGLRIPITRRYHRLSLLDNPGRALRECPCPALIRPIGSHGGQDLVLAETAEDVTRTLSEIVTDEVYFTEFRDFQSPDGLYRKLRLVCVDGHFFPVHMAIGGHWLSHYFRTNMAERADLRLEEARFLHDPETYLGTQVMKGLYELASRVKLGYFGLDAALDRDGALILFECNATMLVRHTDRPALFDYKREPAERIREAVSAMLHRVAAEA